MTDAKPVTIAYVGGGSLEWAQVLMADLALEPRLRADVRLYDIDRAAAERNAAIGARYAPVSLGPPARYRAVGSLAEAMEGADVVLVSILPGGFDAMASDLAIPERHGIRQAVGDTVGPGGFVRALRAVPMMAEILRAAEAHAPEAAICNLTNPMSVLTGAMHALRPGLRAWGECHELVRVKDQIAMLANREANEARHDRWDVEANVLGINHFTFVDRAAVGGRDMTQAYRAFVAENAARGYHQAETKEGPEHAHYFGTRNRVAFDLMGRFGIPGAAGDRHMAEFLPAADYLEAHEGWGFTLTPVEFRRRQQEARLARAEALASGGTAPDPVRSAEDITHQIAGLMGAGAFVSNVNLPNRGQIENLPMGAIVESNAVFSPLGPTPMLAGRMPDALAAIVADHAERQSALLTAILEERADALPALFHADPLVRPLPRREADAMLAEMVAATANVLPDWVARGL